MATKPGMIASLVIGLVSVTAATAAQVENLSGVSLTPARQAEGLLVARCAVCHSTDLITQQRLPKERWVATVEKMRHWGADLSPEEAEILVGYLASRYHPDAPERLAPPDAALEKTESFPQESAGTGPLSGVAARGSRIFERNCQVCHGQGALGGFGPKLVKNPILQHEDRFREVVLHGRGSMPAWGGLLSPQELADLRAWLLTR